MIVAALVGGGIGRIISSFTRDCYLRAGRAGMAVRYPVQGWFGFFKLRTYRFTWSEIADIEHYTFTYGVLTVVRELRITAGNGIKVTIPREYFVDGTQALQDKLLAIMRRGGT